MSIQVPPENREYLGRTVRVGPHPNVWLFGSILALVTLLAFQRSKPAVKAPTQGLREQETANRTLSAMVGKWNGTGTNSSGAAEDRAEFEWILDGRFLRQRYGFDGDRYRSEAYYWYDPSQRRFEISQFNDGADHRVRMINGRVGDTQLVLNDNRDRTGDRVTIRFNPGGSLVIVQWREGRSRPHFRRHMTYYKLQRP